MPRARRKRSSFRGVPPSKMATVKSLEDMLSSEVDEPAVNALVASLESQLASTNVQHPNQDVGSIASVNHVNSTVDAAVVRLLDGSKLAVAPATQAATTTSKSVVSSISQFSDDLSSATSTASSVMVTLPGALPASGYITQVTGAPQQTFFSPAGGATLVANRPLTTSNQDIKIVYTTQSIVSSAVNNSLRSNLKGTTISNGNPTPVNITIRPGQPLVSASTVNALSGSTTSMSAIHDLANIASQQTPIVIPNTCGSSVPATSIVTVSSQGKSASRPTTRMQLRDRGGKSIMELSNAKVVVTARPQESTTSSTVTTQPAIVTTVATKSQPVSSHHVNVVSQVVTNPSLLPPGVQIINVNPRLGTPGLGAKTLAPRVLVTNPVRIAAAPQIMTTRPGVAGQRGMTPNAQIRVESPYRQVHVARSCLSPKIVPLQGSRSKNTITLQPGMVRGAIIVKTENGPLQVVNLAGGSGGSLPAGTTYRLQSLPPGTQGVRTMSPQQMTVTVPVSGTSIKGNQTTVSGAQTIVGTILHQGTPLSAVGSRLQGPNMSSQAHQTVAVKVGVNGNLSTPLTVQTATANNQTPSAPSQMSPNTAKKKCKNFLSTLIRLADEQPPSVAKSVRNLIQGIIDGTIQAEEFTAKLQKELNSAPQPYLVPFLKKNLPFLRHSLITKELTIEGVRPPPPGALSLPHPSQMGNFHLQASQKRPQIGTPVRLVTTSSSQLIHTNQSITQRFVTPRVQNSFIGPPKSLLVSQMNKATLSGSVAASSPATVSALQAKSVLSRALPLLTAKDKGKNTFSALRDDDDINDVAAMGGVNLVEESQKILASNSELVGTQIRSCKDESFLLTGSLFRKVHLNATKHGLEEVASEVPALIAHAAQEMLKSMVEKLAIIAEHRVDNPKNDCRYEVTQDVKTQIKFLDELDRIERQRHEKQEWEILLRAAKSRSKLEDPEQLKLKQKAKEMQRAELEKMRQQEANTTALLAIGPRKKMKLDPSASRSNQVNTSGSSTINNTYQKALPRPRVKRVNLRDLLFLMEQEQETVRTPLLYKTYMK